MQAVVEAVVVKIAFGEAVTLIGPKVTLSVQPFISITCKLGLNELAS